MVGDRRWNARSCSLSPIIDHLSPVSVGVAIRHKKTLSERPRGLDRRRNFLSSIPRAAGRTEHHGSRPLASRPGCYDVLGPDPSVVLDEITPQTTGTVRRKQEGPIAGCGRAFFQLPFFGPKSQLSLWLLEPARCAPAFRGGALWCRDPVLRTQSVGRSATAAR